MGITVENFIKTFKINSKAKDKTFNDFMSKHIVTKYIDITTKIFWCNNIAENTTHFEDGDVKIVKYDSVGRYLLFTMVLIKLYTDIDINFEDGKYVKQYDQLNEAGIIDEIISMIPEKEYAEFNMILDMKVDDFANNEYSVAAILYNIKQSLFMSSNAIAEVLSSDKIKELINSK